MCSYFSSNAESAAKKNGLDKPTSVRVDFSVSAAFDFVF